MSETFLVFPPLSESVICGSNLFDASCEIQFLESSDKCSVIMNKPGDVGQNSENVFVIISLNEPAPEEEILATDLVKNALQKSSTAEAALEELISNILNIKEDSKYAFVICDRNEAYVLNISSGIFAAEQFSSGFHVIPKGFSVGAKIAKQSEGGDTSSAFPPAPKISWPIDEPTSGFDVSKMFKVLRARAGASAENIPTNSFVATLNPNGISCAWLTATPNPQESVFKPFIFTQNASLSPLTQIQDGEQETLLEKLHKNRDWAKVGELLQSLEKTCVDEVIGYINEKNGELDRELFQELTKDCVEAEVKFYR